MTSSPSVEVIISAARSSESLGKAIESVKSQGYPGVKSIVVAASDPETAEVARAHGAEVIDNPSGKTPVGLNLALSRTSAEIIVRVDAHSVLPPGYIERAVEVLERTGAHNVGGLQVPVGTTVWQKAIAAAMTSRAGAGDARHRVGGEAGPVETVYLGVFRRSILERIGGFDERFERTQDYELNHRIRQVGGVVWFDPSLEVTYQPRRSLGALARQYFEYGRWKRVFSRVHRGALLWRQVAPPALVVALAAALVAGFWWRPAWLLPAVYVVAVFLAGLVELPRIGWAAFGVGPALATMHLSWGLGFLFPPRSDRRRAIGPRAI